MYAWLLLDFIKPNQSGGKSEVNYVNAYCEDLVFRTVKVLRWDIEMLRRIKYYQNNHVDNGITQLSFNNQQ